jgi:tetratricopeptide (TPR) repeat protein
MSDVEELKSRARRAEAAGDYRLALESYQEALERERETTDPDRMDPALRLRTADLHFRLGDPERALDAYLKASDLYARQGLIPNAIAVCNKVLGVYPDHVESHRILAELQLEIGLTADARNNLLHYLEEVAGRGRIDAALEAGQAFLDQEPDQEVAVAVAEMLAEEGRTGQAMQVLRGVWEERTGLRQPAGRIEACARRLDPEEDLSAWRPVWPPPRKEQKPTREEAGEPAGDEGSPGDADGPSAADDGPPAVTTAARPAGEAPATAAALEEPPAGSGSGDSGSGDSSSEASVPPPMHNGARMGPTAKTEGASEWAESSEASEASAPEPRRAPPRPPASAANGAPDPEEELREGLELVEEMLEVAPDHLELHRRRVLYARRLGDLGLLERALVELGEVLLERGSHRGARFVFQEVREQLNPGSAAAFDGLRRLDRLEEAPDERTRREEGAESADDEEGADGEEEARQAAPRATGVDRQFRRRLREALSSSSRELAWLHAAAEGCGAGRRGAAGASGGGGPGAGDPVPGPSHELLGRYLLMRDRPEEAAEHLRVALERSPGGGERSAELLYHLGRAWRRAGEPARARECFERLAGVDSDFRAAWDVVSPDGG